ncbi:MAG: hypothetical protein ACXVQU_13190 [Actinomycetota bacterium]|jgi:hypothetical protein
MSLSALVPERADDVDGLSRIGEEFAFAAPEPPWAPLAGDTPRAVGRLLAFVAAVGLGTGIAVWIAGEMVASAIRALF